MVSARRFRQACIDQWKDEVRNNREAVPHASQGLSWTRDWTAYLLEGEDAFLKKVADRLKLRMRPNVRTPDVFSRPKGEDADVDRMAKVVPFTVEPPLETTGSRVRHETA